MTTLTEAPNARPGHEAPLSGVSVAILDESFTADPIGEGVLTAALSHAAIARARMTRLDTMSARPERS